MLRDRIFTGLLIGLFAAMAFAPAFLGAQGACIAAWETGAVETYQRAVLQAQGHVFSPHCVQDCDQVVTDALASYERAALQAQGQVFNDIPIAQQEWLSRAELQAQGQRFVETQTSACIEEEPDPA